MECGGAGFNIPTWDQLARMREVVIVVGFTIIASWGLIQWSWWRNHRAKEKHLDWLRKQKSGSDTDHC